MSTRFPSAAHEILFAHIAGVSRASFFVKRPVLSDAAALRWHSLSARLDSGEPLHYLLGYRAFYDCDIPVDARVLIPRPETELLVDAVIAWVQKSGLTAPKILDLGTGSGCIAIALARALPDAQITASDFSHDAIARARMTVQSLDLEAHITFMQGDLLALFLDTAFDCIVTNLPYVGTKKHDFVEDSVRHFEPSAALFAGEDGLDLYKRFFEQLRALAEKPRVVFGEFGNTQKQDLQALMDPSWKVVFYKDLAGLDRYFSLQIL